MSLSFGLPAASFIAIRWSSEAKTITHALGRRRVPAGFRAS